MILLILVVKSIKCEQLLIPGSRGNYIKQNIEFHIKSFCQTSNSLWPLRVQTLTNLQFSMCFFSPSTVFLLTLLHFGQVTRPLATICSCQRSSWLPVGCEHISFIALSRCSLRSLNRIRSSRPFVEVPPLQTEFILEQNFCLISLKTMSVTDKKENFWSDSWSSRVLSERCNLRGLWLVGAAHLEGK